MRPVQSGHMHYVLVINEGARDLKFQQGNMCRYKRADAPLLLQDLLACIFQKLHEISNLRLPPGGWMTESA